MLFDARQFLMNYYHRLEMLISEQLKRKQKMFKLLPSSSFVAFIKSCLTLDTSIQIPSVIFKFKTIFNRYVTIQLCPVIRFGIQQMPPNFCHVCEMLILSMNSFQIREVSKDITFVLLCKFVFGVRQILMNQGHI